MTEKGAGTSTTRPLTPREREIVLLLSLGKTTPEIARLLSLSEGSVSTYVARGRQKLNAATIPHMVAIAITLKLIPGPIEEGTLAEAS